MRFYCRFLSVLLLLVSLTCATQGSSLRTRRSVWNEIGNTLNNVGEKIKDTIKTKIEPLFHRHSTIGPETTTPTLEPEPDYGTSPFYRGPKKKLTFKTSEAANKIQPGGSQWPKICASNILRGKIRARKNRTRYCDNKGRWTSLRDAKAPQIAVKDSRNKDSMANNRRIFRSCYKNLVREMSRRNSEFRLEYNFTEIRECRQYTSQEQGIQTDKVWSQDYALDEVRARNTETQDRGVQTDPPRTIGTPTDHKPPESAATVPSATVTKLEQPGEHDRTRDLRVDLTLARSGQACRAKFSLDRSSPGSSTSSIRSSLTAGRFASSLREESSRRAIASGCQGASPRRSSRRKFKTGKFFENASRPIVCWNCRSAQHYYSDCPWPRERQYCYGCGRDGVTLRTCPNCGIEWKNSGFYHPDMGHLGTQKFSKEQLTVDTSSVSSPE